MKKLWLIALGIILLSSGLFYGYLTLQKSRTSKASVVQPKEPDFGPYMQSVQTRIKSFWHPPKSNNSKRVIVLFSINRSGEVLKSKIQQTSGVASIDEAALDAVQNSQPFPPLPASAPSAVDIEFSFDYNVWNTTAPQFAREGGSLSGDSSIHTPPSSLPAYGAGEAQVGMVEPSPESKKLNNDGLLALKRHQFVVAIEKLRKALLRPPGNYLAQENMAKAYNNYGLSLSKRPYLSLALLHMSCLLDPSDENFDNLDKVIAKLPKDPDNFDDRVYLGDRAFAESNAVGAIVEYQRALEIKEEFRTRKKLEAAYKLFRASKDPIAEMCRAGYIFVNIPPVEKINNAAHTDFGPFMQDLKTRVERSWHPSASKYSCTVRIVLDVDRSGKSSTFVLGKNDSVLQAAALSAVYQAQPFKPLPQGSPQVEGIVLEFEYRTDGHKNRVLARLDPYTYVGLPNM